MASAGEFGVVRILVSDPERGFAALKESHFTVTERRILVALIDDRPGALHELLVTLASSRVNVEDCYGFVLEGGSKAAIVFEVEKFPEAEKALAGTGIHLIPDDEIYRLVGGHAMIWNTDYETLPRDEPGDAAGRAPVPARRRAVPAGCRSIGRRWTRWA